MPTNPEVIVVGALATKGSNISSLRYTAEAISGGESPVHYVDGGIINKDERLSVATPSQQLLQIDTIIEHSPRKNFLVLSQSMGALAALSALEKDYSTKQVSALSIAPPLLFPSDTIRSERINGRSIVTKDEVILPSRSYALGDTGPTVFNPNPETLPEPLPVIAPPELYDEIDEANADYLGRTLQALLRKKLHIIMPTEDWNETAMNTVHALQNEHNNLPITWLNGPHSLITEDSLLRHNIKEMAAIAHDLDQTTPFKPQR